MQAQKNSKTHMIDAGLARQDGKTPTACAANKTDFSKIECQIDNKSRSLFLPKTILGELGVELRRNITDEDARQILLSPSILAELEGILNRNKSLQATEKELRRLSEPEVRQILTANGVSERHVNVNNTNTFYLEAGDSSRDTVLLIHGGGNSAAYRAWKYQILELAENYHVIAPDLPGFGNTPKPKDKCTLNYYVDHFMSSFMDAVGVEKASIVSSSMGGWIALGFTLENTGRVNKLVGIGSGGVADREIPLVVRELTIFPGLAKFLITKLHSNEKIVRKVLQALNGNQPVSETYFRMTDEYLSKDGFTPAFLEFINDQLMSSPREVAADFIRNKIEHKDIVRGFRTVYMNSFTYLNKANVPYLLAHGGNDPIFKLSSIEASAAKLEHCTLVKFECMHGPHLEVPKDFNPVLMGFLDPVAEVKAPEERRGLKGLVRNITDKIKRGPES